MNDVEIREPYRKRPIRLLQVATMAENWNVKFYGIAYEADAPRDDLIVEVLPLFRSHLATLARAKTHKIAFAVIHDGRQCDFASFFWWENENELCAQIWCRDGKSGGWTTHSKVVGCVWDMRVMAFESEAWVRHVLQGGDMQSYLLAKLEGNF